MLNALLNARCFDPVIPLLAIYDYVYMREIIYVKRHQLQHCNSKYWKQLKHPLIAIPNLDMYPQQSKTGIQTNACTQLFTATLLTTAKSWKNSKCPST